MPKSYRLRLRKNSRKHISRKTYRKKSLMKKQKYRKKSVVKKSRQKGGGTCRPRGISQTRCLGPPFGV